jgi:hypothetical protein
MTDIKTSLVHMLTDEAKNNKKVGTSIYASQGWIDKTKHKGTTK